LNIIVNLPVWTDRSDDTARWWAERMRMKFQQQQWQRRRRARRQCQL